MTAKFSASADGTKVYLGNASENALEIDATTKLILPVSPYAFQGAQAANVSFAPVGNVAANNVQAAIAELDSEKLQIAPGTVLQQCVFYDAGSSTSNSSYTNLLAATKGINPKSANSIILIEASGQFLVSPLAATNVNAAFAIYRGSVATQVGSGMNISAPSGSGGVGNTIMGTIRAMITNTSLAQIAFGLMGAVGSSSYSCSATELIITLTEIQN